MKTKNEYVARIYLDNGAKFCTKLTKRIADNKSAEEIIRYYAEKTYYSHAVDFQVTEHLAGLEKIEIIHYKIIDNLPSTEIYIIK